MKLKGLLCDSPQSELLPTRMRLIRHLLIQRRAQARLPLQAGAIKGMKNFNKVHILLLSLHARDSLRLTAVVSFSALPCVSIPENCLVEPFWASCSGWLLLLHKSQNSSSIEEAMANVSICPGSVLCRLEQLLHPDLEFRIGFQCERQSALTNCRLDMQLIGKPHVRIGRDSKYESLDTLANVTYHQPGETMRYTSASVLDILNYLQDEAKCGNPTKPLHNELPARDALALLVAASAQSALRCLHNGQIHHCFTDPKPTSKQVSPLATKMRCYAHQHHMIDRCKR